MIILIGESASGKSNIEKGLVKNGFNKTIGYTSRPMRDGEVDGVDYIFISKEEFQNLILQEYFCEYEIYNDWYYGTAKKDCKDDTVKVVAPSGFRQLKAIPELNIISFYIHADVRERVKRMIDRGDNLLEVFRRTFSDEGAFQGISRETDYVIENGDFKGYERIIKILNGGRND